MNVLGSRIKKERENLNLSREDLAKKLGVSYSAIAMYEQGNREPNNEIILKNLQALRKEYPTKPIRVRTPLVPGFNDTDEEVLAIADFVHSLPQMEYEVLKYHRFGINKYTYIGREYPMDTTVDMPEERFAHFKKLVGQE